MTFTAMLLTLAACGGGASSTAPEASKATSGDSTDFTPVEWRMSNQHPEGSIADIADKEMIEEIEKATEGRVKITLYNNNQLGDYLSVFDEVMVGSIQIHHGSTNEAYDSRVLGPFLPYLSTGYGQLETLYAPDGYLFQTLHDTVYTKLGMELMGFFCEGFDGVGTSKPVTNAATSGADKGVSIRVPAMETFNQCNLNLGFRTTSIPYSDTYTALQTGLADGASGVPANLFYLNFRDVIKYFYDYQQVQEATSILINKQAFDALLPEDQQAIRDIIQSKCTESCKLAEEDEDKYKDMLRKEGIEVIEFTDEERAAFAAECHEKVWPILAETFTQEFLDGCLADAQK
ncbi:MAG: TRAP transporter substrate-binding protein DctP [Anaerotruncus sp.]|nr:TRAP transporter substrate-binding protein DctP [Anaerotruncus sp.]